MMSFKKKFKRGLRKTTGLLWDAWQLDQQIPLQSLNRTLLEYEIENFGEDEFYSPIKPDHLSKKIKYLKYHYNPQAIPQPYTFKIRNATIYRNEVLDPANPKRIILETLPEVTRWQEGLNYRISPLNRMRMKRHSKLGPDISKGFIFSNPWWDNFFHFITDSCLRYALARKNGIVTNDTPIILRSYPTHSWQKSYLELLGINFENCPTIEEKPLNVSELTILSSCRFRSVCSKQSIEAHKSLLFKALELEQTIGTQKIYISRKNANHRRIKNEAEVVKLLTHRGFKVLHLEDLSVPKQIELFAKASTIVAPHGAGLVNLIYSNCPNVIELLPNDRWNWGYFLTLTNSVDGNYVPIVSNSGTGKEDFEVPVSEIEKTLNYIELQGSVR